MMKSREVNLKFNSNKCEFAKTSIGFLGHVVSKKRDATLSKESEGNI
jgi:hypothetical protein